MNNHHLLSVASLNLAGLSSTVRRNQLFEFCVAQTLNVIGLQELSFSSANTWKSVYANVGPRGRGTGLLVKSNLCAANV